MTTPITTDEWPGHGPHTLRLTAQPLNTAASVARLYGDGPLSRALDAADLALTDAPHCGIYSAVTAS